MKRSIVFMFVITLSISFKEGFAQRIDSLKTPKVGVKCPDFTFVNTDDKKTRLSGYKGKNVILDFWSLGCIPCFKAFPKIDEFKRAYSNELEFILISKEDEKAKKVFSDFVTRLGLELKSVYDTEIFRAFATQVPTYVWIDQNGVIRAITGPLELTDENIGKFISGQAFHFKDVGWSTIQKSRAVFDYSKPFLVNNNGGANDTSFLYRSVLSSWNDEMATFNPNRIDYDRREAKFEALGENLTSLYMMAYFGGGYNISKSGQAATIKDYYYKPIIDTADSVRFENERFCYSLICPPKKGTKAMLMKNMQHDLANYFEFEARIEPKEVSCVALELDTSRLNNIKSKGGERIYDHMPTYIKVRNTNFSDVYERLYQSWRYGKDILLVDRTGLDDMPVDLDLDILLTEGVEGLEAKLSKMGFRFVPSKVTLPCLVIRDPEPVIDVADRNIN